MQHGLHSYLDAPPQDGPSATSAPPPTKKRVPPKDKHTTHDCRPGLMHMPSLPPAQQPDATNMGLWCVLTSASTRCRAAGRHPGYPGRNDAARNGTSHSILPVQIHTFAYIARRPGSPGLYRDHSRPPWPWAPVTCTAAGSRQVCVHSGKCKSECAQVRTVPSHARCSVKPIALAQTLAATEPAAWKPTSRSKGKGWAPNATTYYTYHHLSWACSHPPAPWLRRLCPGQWAHSLASGFDDQAADRR